MASDDLNKFYKGKKVLITGGLGFIGLNIIKQLMYLDAEMTVLDDCIYPQIKKLIDPICSLIVADIRDENKIGHAVRGQDIIFNLAGKSGAADSNKEPFIDLDVNSRGTLTILEACRRFNPHVTIIYPSSRLVYGKPRYLPVDENHPLAPDSIHAINKLTVENYHILYSKLYGLKTTVLRISNPYGPMQIGNARTYGIANVFIQSAVKGENIPIFGDGQQRRDYIYIDDLVHAFLKAGIRQEASIRIMNIGTHSSVSLLDFVQMAIEVAGSGNILKVPWSTDNKLIETGDYQSNIDLAVRELDWCPVTKLKDGITQTIEFYRHGESCLLHYYLNSQHNTKSAE